MQKAAYIFTLFLLTFSLAIAQNFQNKTVFEIKGSVKGKENMEPISGVEVSTSSGNYTVTDGLGEFRIKASVGDELVIRGAELETVYYRIKSDEDVTILVEGYQSNASSSKLNKNAISHQTYLDSANFYKKNDIGKSIDFITQSISSLGKRANKKQLAEALTMLGEVYQYHKQYDLAISNYKDALDAQKTIKTTLLLGNVYLLNQEYTNAESIFLPLENVKGMVPFQRVQLYEGLGDSYKNLGEINKAVTFYNEGLTIAKKNQIEPKVVDLNSKIADAYASANRKVEAEGYYNQSLDLAKKEAPQRSVREKEKVADFYNSTNQYSNEIELRKENLQELQLLSAPVAKMDGIGISPDSITTQRINYKIANAYISQNQFDEAIPFLQKSIVEADRDDDLIVQKDATRKLSEVYKQKGDFTKALETYQEYAAVVDTLYVRKEQEISRAARFNNEIALRQSRIDGLEQERELSQSKYDLALTSQQLTQERYKRQNWIIYSLILGLILLGLSTFFFYRSNNQQKLANNLLALKSLRSQMNPHFIFNALNSVNNYISKSDERSANRYLSDFSTLMRSVLENSEEDFILLSKELELLELYVKLEHSRFPDKFDYEINLDDHIDVDAFQIPPMLLQPYIENAIWHGLRYKEEKGFLSINLNQKSDEIIEIAIADNGIGRKKSAELKTSNQKKQKSKGMGNIKKRIAILNDMYKDKVDVFITNLNDEEGTKVILTLKKD
ncbi:tetratricopeptide (TPR) repeat protein [Saonia flava]|uniref:Tetratricopeptide (TPR) repeat protein n=1 Tax=Saonia flava TaxID=523696 RepID=A0A846QXG4_9FLAO|nr:histidine kinase [Saonia flava]NJB70923.1 tetratricopeptide (TPR) repeat protein [Saonia flava]